MSSYNQPNIDSSHHYLHVLSDKISYRNLKYGIKFYFHYYSRADRNMLIRLQHVLIFVGISMLLFVPVYWFAYKSSFLPLIIGFNVVWLAWLIQTGWSYLLKRYGMETLMLSAQSTYISQCIALGDKRFVIRNYRLSHKATLCKIRSSTKSNAFLGVAGFKMIKVIHPSPSVQIKQIGLMISSRDYEKICQLFLTHECE